MTDTADEYELAAELFDDDLGVRRQPGTVSWPPTSPLYRTLLDSLDEGEQTAVLEAIRHHHDEVRAGEAVGDRVSEAL